MATIDDGARLRIRAMVRLGDLGDWQLAVVLAVEAESAGPGSEEAVAEAAGVDVGVVREGMARLAASR